MAVKLITLKCPDCGASIEIDNNREHAFCTYCGAKILIHNENEHIYHYVDEAEIIQAQTDREIRLKEMEYIEKKRDEADKEQKEKERKRKRIKKAAVISFIISIIMVIIGLLVRNASNPESNIYNLAVNISGCGAILYILSLAVYAAVKKRE